MSSSEVRLIRFAQQWSLLHPLCPAVEPVSFVSLAVRHWCTVSKGPRRSLPWPAQVKRLEGALSKAMEATRVALISKRARKPVPEGLPPIRLPTASLTPLASSPVGAEASLPQSPGLAISPENSRAAKVPPGLPPGMPPPLPNN